MVYQPQVHHDHGKVWGPKHYCAGVTLFTEKFLPHYHRIAEDSMLIAPLGLKVFDFACAQRSIWRERGITDPACS